MKQNIKNKRGRSRKYNLININNKHSLVTLILFFFLLFAIPIMQISQVLALGITPGRTTLNYEPGLEANVAFSVLNNEHKNMQVLFMVQGELNDSITLYENMMGFITTMCSALKNPKSKI